MDSCGHPRCFSCLVLDNHCTVCQSILNRRQSWICSVDSLSSTDESKDKNKLHQISTQHHLFSKEQYFRTLYRYNPESSEVQKSCLTVRENKQRKKSAHENQHKESPESENINNTSRVMITPLTPHSPGFWSEMKHFRNKKYNEINDSKTGNFREEPNNKNKNKVHPENKDLKSKKQDKRICTTRKKNHSDDKNLSIKKTNEDIDKLTKINFLLSGHSNAWQQTKDLFSSTSSCLVKDKIRRDQEPDLRKIFWKP